MGPVIYNADSDVLYVRLRDAPATVTEFLDELRALDYSADHAVVGIEFIGASAGVHLGDVPFATTVQELIRDSGHKIPILAF